MDLAARVKHGLMFIDRETFSDLELHQQGRDSLPGRLDRTRTVAGSRRLRERLGQPMSDPELLKMALSGPAFLASVPPPPPLDGEAIHTLTQYLDSRIMTLGDRSLRPGLTEAAWVGLRDPELLTLARVGIPAARRVVENMEALVPPLLAMAPPRGLAVVLESIAGLLEKLRLSELWMRGSQSWRVLAADQALRGRHRGDLVRLLSLLADLDLQIALAQLIGEGMVVPEVDSDVDFLVDIAGAWHPLLETPVRNSIRLTPTDGVLLITGPNMAGKTTFLRAVGTCVHLAHCGFPVPAAAMRFRPLDAFFASVNPRDAMDQGVSLFLSEVLRVREVLTHAQRGERVLALFDELFRGTNQGDARAASRAVLTAAATCPTLGLIISSHLTELAAEDLPDAPGVLLGCFEGEVRGEGLHFDYRLKEGASAQRLGLELFRRTGVESLLGRLPRGSGARVP